MRPACALWILLLAGPVRADEPPPPLDGMISLGAAPISREDRAVVRSIVEGEGLRERLEVRLRARQLGPGAWRALARRAPAIAGEVSTPVTAAGLDLLGEIPDEVITAAIDGREQALAWSSPLVDRFARALGVQPTPEITLRRVGSGLGVYLGSRGTVLADDPASVPPSRTRALARRLLAPGYDGWRTAQSGPFVLHTERSPAPRLARHMERAFERVVERTGIDPDIDDVHVWAHRSVRHMARFGQHVNHADPSKRRIVWSRGATLGHETVHVVLREAWGPSGSTLAEEGIATLLSDRFALGPFTPVAPRWSSRRMQRRMGGLVSWETLPEAGEVHRYLQTAALAGAVEAALGADGLCDLWAAPDLLVAAEELLGEGWRGAVAAWLAGSGNSRPGATSP